MLSNEYTELCVYTPLVGLQHELDLQARQVCWHHEYSLLGKCCVEGRIELCNYESKGGKDLLAALARYLEYSFSKMEHTCMKTFLKNVPHT